jgi:transcriptional regulator with XRE-family HTH domain
MSDLDLARRFGENMKRCRRQADISQEELARRAGLHRTEIGQLERGIRLPRLDTLVKLMGALEATPDELFARLHWKQATSRTAISRRVERGAPADP